MNNKKAQITMETILIYGIIAIVVLTGIGALIYFGVFDLGNYLPDKCQFVTGDLNCEQWVVEAGVPVEFGIRNNQNQRLDIFTISLTQPEGFNIFTDGGGASTCTITCNGAAGVSANPKGAVGCTQPATCLIDTAFKGQKVKLNTVVEYKPFNGAITQKSGGEMIVKVQ